MDNKKLLLNASLTAVIAGVGTKVFFDGYEDANLFGVNMPAYMAVAGATGLGSIVSDMSSEMVIKKLGLSNQLVNNVEFFTQIGLCGGASTAVLALSGLPMESAPSTFLLGSASKFGADYSYERLFSPTRGIIQF